MKRKKQLLSLFLTLLMLVGLAGCANDGTAGGVGNGNGTEMDGSTGNAGTPDGGSDAAYGGKGRFLESELSLPDTVNRLKTARILADGSILALGYDLSSMRYYLLRTQNMGTDWDSVKLEGMSLNYVANAAVSPEGTAVLLDNYGAMAVASPDGNVQMGRLSLPEISGGNENQVLEVQYTADGTLLVLDMQGKLYRAEVSTGVLEEVVKNLTESIDYFGIAGNRILAVTGSGVQVIDSMSGERITDETLHAVTNGNQEGRASEDSYPVVFTEGTEENSVVYVNHEGLFYHQDGGSVNEQLINGSLVSLGDTSLSLLNVMTLSDTAYLVLGTDSLSNSRLYQYTYDTEASAVPEKQLTVYALEDSSVLQQAVSLFQKQNPEVFVKKVIGMSGSDGITAEDALRTLSTDIMAGNGPDVIILDGIPVDSYIEKGILADISALVEEIDKTDGFFSNIMEVYRKDGKLYEMPSRFFVSVIAGDENVLAAGKSLAELNDYAKRVRQENARANVMMPMTAVGLLNELFYMDSANWATENGIPTEAAIRDFLTAAQEMYGLDTYSEEEYNPDVTNYSIHGGVLYGSISFGEGFRLSAETAISFGTIADMDDLQEVYAMEAQAGGDYRIFGGENGSFVPYVSVGILAGQEENQAAREFVRVILGKECQTASDSGFPVNVKAYQEKQGLQAEYSIGFSGPDGKVYGAEMKELTQEQFARLTGELESLKKCALNDRVIREMVIEEGEKCLNGSQSLEAAVAAIMQKVRLYASE